MLMIAAALLLCSLAACEELSFVDVTVEDGSAQPTRTPLQAPTQTALPPAGAVQWYFTTPDGSGGSEALEAALIASIDAAQEQVDVAMYNFTLTSAADALLRADQRGVRVRVVVDSDALDSRALSRLSAGGIPVTGDNRESLMHNKFILIDGRVVWTGSMNLTPNGLFDDDNNMVRVESPEMAALYSEEFREMAELDRFGAGASIPDGENQLDLGGIPAEVYFSPDDRPAKRLVALLRGAEKQIVILAYTLTRNDLRDALLDAAQRGVQVTVIFEEERSGDQGGEYESLREAGLDVRLDDNPGLMHHKVIVIDGEIVALGSFNYTRAADESNDENILILHDAAAAQAFLAEAARMPTR